MEKQSTDLDVMSEKNKDRSSLLEFSFKKRKFASNEVTETESSTHVTVGSGLLDTFLSWIKKLFGGGFWYLLIYGKKYWILNLTFQVVHL